jgi:hypothetical protein
MGACFQTYSRDAKLTPAQLKADFRQVQEQDRHENGHEYSGGFGQCRGLEVTSQEFTNARDANEWLADNTQKWEAAKAVKLTESKKRVFWLVGGWCAE